MPASVVPTVSDVVSAESIVHKYMSPAPLIRSYPLEQELNLAPSQRVWIKDYGWTPVGSFKLMGALNWMHANLDEISDRPVTAHSSGNFASGISFAGAQFGKSVVVVMPDCAPDIKFRRTRAFGAEIRTYDKRLDHKTGQRDKLTREIANKENAVQASPYDDPHVIAGNGVGGLEIVKELTASQRQLSQFLCPVSGGGLMAGHALAIADSFPDAKIIGVEPEGANDFCQSLSAGERVRVDHPESICDGLLSYDVGMCNWPILSSMVHSATTVADQETKSAMQWLDEQHGLRTEPSGAIGVAALLSRKVLPPDSGDIVIVVSGRNVDKAAFENWVNVG